MACKLNRHNEFRVHNSSSSKNDKAQEISFYSMHDEEKKFNKVTTKCGASSGFQMPLHYPRYKKADYEKMEEWKVDVLLREYGLDSFKGTLDEKREFAMGTFFLA
ncbi:hypothetical protein C5167_039029 [Papaver somniferum]|uniref:DUF7722 domain-containing protein n=1 Tax=Papaver somniferum TaxID=3469 RepID=A0A4Y7IEY9_PAPSO|nr:uncharacterized protein LOC113333051 [Papaver somniferum]RZC46068.1 hypothetical protein C5167_039029 [Papaver somniferum]